MGNINFIPIEVLSFRKTKELKIPQQNHLSLQVRGTCSVFRPLRIDVSL